MKSWHCVGLEAPYTYLQCSVCLALQVPHASGTEAQAPSGDGSGAAAQAAQLSAHRAQAERCVMS